jgi:hypothetical protein
MTFLYCLRRGKAAPLCNTTPALVNTDKKENQSFLIYKEIQNGAVAKS